MADREGTCDGGSMVALGSVLHAAVRPRLLVARSCDPVVREEAEGMGYPAELTITVHTSAGKRLAIAQASAPGPSRIVVSQLPCLPD